jgi:drug/metabolite transporter (DMT)-like permease
MVMCVNDATAVVFACATAFATRERAAAIDVLLPPLDRDCLVVVGAALLGWAGLMGNIKGYQSVSVAAVASIAGSSSIPFNCASLALDLSTAGMPSRCLLAAGYVIAYPSRLVSSDVYQVLFFREPLDALSVTGATIVLATTIGTAIVRHQAQAQQ